MYNLVSSKYKLKLISMLMLLSGNGVGGEENMSVSCRLK